MLKGWGNGSSVSMAEHDDWELSLPFLFSPFLSLSLSLPPPPTSPDVQVAGVMDQFERQFEHLDVQTQTMEEAMSGVTTLTVPEVRILENHLWNVDFMHTVVS